MHTITVLPVVHVTNYQKWLNADYLALNINDRMPADSALPETMHVSIAYIMMARKAGVYTTTLALSILGKAYKFKLAHKDVQWYDAWVNSLDLKESRPQSWKDVDIRLLEQAFEAVVNKNIKQITKAITTAYGN